MVGNSLIHQNMASSSVRKFVSSVSLSFRTYGFSFTYYAKRYLYAVDVFSSFREETSLEKAKESMI